MLYVEHCSLMPKTGQLSYALCYKSGYKFTFQLCKYLPLQSSISMNSFPNVKEKRIPEGKE